MPGLFEPNTPGTTLIQELTFMKSAQGLFHVGATLGLLSVDILHLTALGLFRVGATLGLLSVYILHLTALGLFDVGATLGFSP